MSLAASLRRPPSEEALLEGLGQRLTFHPVTAPWSLLGRIPGRIAVNLHLDWTPRRCPRRFTGSPHAMCKSFTDRCQRIPQLTLHLSYYTSCTSASDVVFPFSLGAFLSWTASAKRFLSITLLLERMYNTLPTISVKRVACIKLVCYCAQLLRRSLFLCPSVMRVMRGLVILPRV